MAESKLNPKDGNLSPDHFLKLYQEIRVADRELEKVMAEARSARGRKQAILKRAKSDGMDLDAFVMLQKLAKLDEDESDMLMRNLARYSKWLEAPIGLQADMFSDIAEPDAAAAESQNDFAHYDRGYQAGFNGHKIETNPNVAGSSAFAQFVRGWHAGQEAMVHRDLTPKRDAKRAAAGEDQTKTEPKPPRAKAKPDKETAAAKIATEQSGRRRKGPEERTH